MANLSPELRANLLYEDTTHYAGWLKLVLMGVLGLTLIVGLFLLSVDRLGALTMFAVTLVDGFIFSSVFPRRYQIFSDRVRIVLGSPFAYSLHFNHIKGVRLLSGRRVISGKLISANFVTDAGKVVEIARARSAVTISPSRPEAFVEYLNQAIQAYSGRK